MDGRLGCSLFDGRLIRARPQVQGKLVEAGLGLSQRSLFKNNYLSTGFSLIDGQLELYTEPTEEDGYSKREDFLPRETFVSPLLGRQRVKAVMAMGEEEGLYTYGSGRLIDYRTV